MEEFIAFLKKKRIDPEKFRLADPVKFNEFQDLFTQVHVNSFVAQKLFLINQVRRQYHLAAEIGPLPIEPAESENVLVVKPAKKMVVIRKKED